MDEIGANTATDFAGFLDSFQARNMAKIERNAALQLSELQTRLVSLRTAVKKEEKAEDLESTLEEAEKSMRDRTHTIVDRLKQLAQHLQRSIIEHGTLLLSNAAYAEQLKWIVKRYIEAAEISHYESLVVAAVSLGETYTAATAAAHS